MVRLYNAATVENALTDAVSISDVYDRMELDLGDRYRSDAISAAAEHLAWVLEDREGLEDVDIVEELEGWRDDYNPSWTIYTREIDAVICDAGIDRVIECYAGMFGEAPGSASAMIGAVLWDLTGAVISAFEDMDPDDVDMSEAWEDTDD